MTDPRAILEACTHAQVIERGLNSVYTVKYVCRACAERAVEAAREEEIAAALQIVTLVTSRRGKENTAPEYPLNEVWLSIHARRYIAAIRALKERP
jgi:hypothetical protein